MARFRDVLKDRNFLFLWLGQVISNFGDRLNQMALIALVYQRSPGSEMALAKLIAFTIIPVFIIGPIAGVWVDRLNRKNVMVISDITRGLLVLAIPFFIGLRQMPLVYFIIFLTFSISRFFIPSKMAFIPDIVPEEKLLIANTLQNTTQMIGNVVGLVVAGVIVNIPYVGAIGGFYIDSATFFVSAALIAMIIKKNLPSGVKEDLIKSGEALTRSIRRSLLSEIKDGVSYLVKYSDMRFVVYTFFLLMAGIGTISCVIIVFVQHSFGSSTRDLGFIGMFLIAGLFLGTLIFGKIGQRYRKRTVVHLSFIASGISVTLFSVFVDRYPNLVIAGTLSAILGAAVSPIMASVNTLTHETIQKDIRGRVFSSLELVIHLAFMLFMFIAAYAARYIDNMWILVAVGSVFAVCGLAGLISDILRRAKRA